MIRKPKPISDEQALEKMYALCMRAEHSSGEIKQKLYRLGITGARARRIIENLIINRFINDARFARSFAADKMRFALWGRKKIRLALIAKGIDSDNIAEALDNLDADEYFASLMKAARAKAKSLNLDERKDVAKFFAFMAYRGYESDLTSRALRLIREEEKDS